MIPAGPTHLRTARAYLLASRRARFALVALTLVALVGIFADFLAGPEPLLEVGPSGVRVFPAVVGPDTERAGEPPSFAIWPLVRADARAAGPDVLAPPSFAHPLGTDERGRDVFARLVHGTRSALGTALVAIAASLVLGLVLGALAGSGSARWNRRLERFVEAVDTFPAIIVVALLRAIEEAPSVWTVAAGVALVKWAEFARVVRAEVLRVSVEDFVLAARALGASRRRTLLSHLLPHTVGPVSVCAALALASVTLLDTAIAYLSLGPASSAPTWGGLFAEAARHPERPLMLLAPTVAVGLTVGAAHLLADALRDATNPHAVRLRG